MRFQNRARRPYREFSGAAVLLNDPAFVPETLADADATDHPNGENLRLLAIRGTDLMKLVHALYARAASDA